MWKRSKAPSHSVRFIRLYATRCYWTDIQWKYGFHGRILCVAGRTDSLCRQCVGNESIFYISRRWSKDLSISRKIWENSCFRAKRSRLDSRTRYIRGCLCRGCQVSYKNVFFARKYLLSPAQCGTIGSHIHVHRRQKSNEWLCYSCTD